MCICCALSSEKFTRKEKIRRKGIHKHILSVWMIEVPCLEETDLSGPHDTATFIFQPVHHSGKLISSGQVLSSLTIYQRLGIEQYGAPSRWLGTWNSPSQPYLAFSSGARSGGMPSLCALLASESVGPTPSPPPFVFFLISAQLVCFQTARSLSFCNVAFLLFLVGKGREVKNNNSSLVISFYFLPCNFVKLLFSFLHTIGETNWFSRKQIANNWWWWNLFPNSLIIVIISHHFVTSTF